MGDHILRGNGVPELVLGELKPSPNTVVRGSGVYADAIAEIASGTPLHVDANEVIYELIVGATRALNPHAVAFVEVEFISRGFQGAPDGVFG